MEINLQKERIILGIDPGTAVMGYGLVKEIGTKMELISLGVVKMEKIDDHMLKLQRIFEKTVALIDNYHPDCLAIEAPFYGKNIQVMLKLGRAQGVCMAAALSRNIEITEYAPRKIKQSITGNGNATKEQVAAMLQTLLKFTETPDFLDATDGLAVAVCHSFQRVPTGKSGSGKKSYSGWDTFVKDNTNRVAGGIKAKKPERKQVKLLLNLSSIDKNPPGSLNLRHATLHQEDQTFTKATAAEIAGHKRIYENCTFNNCDLSYADLTDVTFIDCTFADCNLSLATVTNSGFQNVKFKHSKLSGINFSKSNDFLFELHFDGCILDNAVFYKKKNKKASFTDCSMIETDLTEADLTDAKFINCNLHRAFFSQTILKNADLRSSYNFTIDPDINNIKKARFSLHGLPGLLSKYDIKIE